MASLRGTQRPLSGDDVPTLEFKGKQHVYAHHLTVPYRPLVPDALKSHGDAANSPDDNLIIHGDNLHALKALLPRYAGRVDCVYIDPPYNTGNGNGGWSYNDNVNSPLMRQWLMQDGPVDGEDLERHDKWLCMMWTRLQILKELLSDDGIIFVSIDDHEVHHLRPMMDEIFGEQNFFATLTRRAMHTVRNSSKDFNINTDFVLAFANRKEWWAEDQERYIRMPADKTANYPHNDDDGRGPYKLDPLHARNYYEPYTHTFDNGVTWEAPSGSYPRYSRETLQDMEHEGRLDFSGAAPRAKRYLSDVQEGRPPDTLLPEEVVRFNATGTSTLAAIFGEGGVFSQPKPFQLVQHLLEIIRRPDALVLDSFAGSGTTAHAVLAQNELDGGSRRFILIECEDYADRITAERVRRVIDGVPDAKDDALRKGLGGSFTYCTLGAPIELEALLKGDALPGYSALAAYVLHTASGISAGAGALEPMSEDGLFYETEKINYYLLYQPKLEWLRSNEGVVNEARANRIEAECKAQRRKAIVFAPAKYISQRDLSAKGITFCQLPYELHNGG